MGTRLLMFGATAFVSGFTVLAQAQPPAKPRPPANSPLLVHRDPAYDAIVLGRARMVKSDWAGALEAFDAALRTSIDVTVRRDRGLCHEQLGHPFPAIDDFRAYLTAFPDAADAEDIRSRLNTLDTANGMGGTGTGGSSSVDGSPSTAANNEDPFAVSTKDGKVSNAGVVAGTGGSARAGNYDQELALNEKYDEADASPLRRGTGLSLGAFGRGFGALSNGVTGYGVGATLRGSLGKVSTIYGEIGYISYQAGSDAATGEREGGLSLGLGYEARLRLDELGSNAIILAGVLNYERVSETNSNARATSNLLDPRGKLGYRHVFGPGLGLEIAGEAAEAISLEKGGTSVTTIGGTVALLVGF